MEAAEVRQYINRIDRLSTIPVVLKRIMEITADPTSSPEDLFTVISRDQPLAARILKVANSSFFRHSGGVTDIEQAVMLLGYEQIRTIALSMSVLMVFSKKGDKNLRNFWAHNYEVGIIASMLSESATMVNASGAFIAGLLHDTGRLIFYSLNAAGYAAFFGTDDLLERESAFFGCEHAAAGSWLAEKALFPKELVTAIRYHHAPSSAPELHDLVSVIALAEALSRRFSPKIEDDGIWTPEHDAIVLEFNISTETLAEMEERFKSEEEAIQTFLEIE